MDEDESSRVADLALFKCSTQEDVYTLSADIGREVERLVDGFGVEAAGSLVPKLIRVLEVLEAAIGQNERLRDEADHLQQTVRQLEHDKQERAHLRKTFEQDLIQIEDLWRSEMNDLTVLVNRLQEENSRLSSSLRVKAHQLADAVDKNEGSLGSSNLQKDAQNGGQCDSGIFTNGLSQSDIDMLNRLKESFNQQAKQLHAYENEVAQQCADIQNLEQQVERLRRKATENSQRTRQLELQLTSITDERDHLLQKLDDERRELESLRHQINTERRDAHDELLEAVIRHSPPNLADYKKVCQEKRDLEVKVRFLERELDFYKPPVAKTPSEDSGSDAASEEVQPKVFPDGNMDDGDLPVQGPINREPDDKLDYSDFPHGSSSLSIKRFFPKLLWSSRKTPLR